MGERDFINQLQKLRWELRDDSIDSLKNADLLLCPATNYPAAPSKTRTPGLQSFTGWVNVLGLPAGVVPVTRVRAEEQAISSAAQQLGPAHFHWCI